MRSLLTRAAQHRKGHRLTPVAFAIFAVAIYVVFTGKSNAAIRAPDNNEIITGTVLSVQNQIENLRHAVKGKEGIELAARLKSGGGFIKRPVSWKIFLRGEHTGQPGKQVFAGKTAIADTVLKPGNYHIEAKYGHVSTSHDVTLLPKTRLSVVFNLNIGGVRSLSRVAGVDATHFSDARHTIYALPDTGPKKFITEKISQGQIVRLAAGHYRIESRFEKGNTLAVAFVTIKPGILTSLNIDHHAALAELSFTKPQSQPLNWEIFSHKGGWRKTGQLAKTRLILAPGLYTITAKIGTSKIVRTISLPKGKATTIVMGN